MRILFLAGREIEYTRNAVLVRALQQLGEVDVVAPAVRPKSLVVSSVWVAARGIAHLLRRRYDLVFIGFYGHLIVHLTAPFVHVPLLFDAFVSNYDTLCFDRQVVSPDSLAGRIAFWIDQAACRRADCVLLDTEQHAAFFAETFALPADTFEVVPVGCRGTVFEPHPQPAPATPLRVLSYSTFQPLHGIDTVLRTAAQTADLPIEFRLIGDGPKRAEMRHLADTLGLTNVTFLPPVSISDIADEVIAAHICLGGHFGQSEKAGRVIPGKIYQMLSVGRPIIAGDTSANRELLSHQKTAYMVPPGDVAALVEAIRTLAGDATLRERMGRAGRRLYEECCSEEKIAAHVGSIVRRLLESCQAG